MARKIIGWTVVGLLGTSLLSSGLAWAGLPAPDPLTSLAGLIGQDPGEIDQELESPPEEDLPQPALEGMATAELKRQAAQAFADAVRAWTGCVAAAASAQGDDETRVTGGFDPRAGCSDHPNPADFGLTDLPSQAQNGNGESGNGENGNGGPPEGVPSGPPEGAGPPEGVGPPGGVPGG